MTVWFGTFIDISSISLTNQCDHTVSDGELTPNSIVPVICLLQSVCMAYETVIYLVQMPAVNNSALCYN